MHPYPKHTHALCVEHTCQEKANALLSYCYSKSIWASSERDGTGTSRKGSI